MTKRVAEQFFCFLAFLWLLLLLKIFYLKLHTSQNRSLFLRENLAKGSVRFRLVRFRLVRFRLVGFDLGLGCTTMKLRIVSFAIFTVKQFRKNILY